MDVEEWSSSYEAGGGGTGLALRRVIFLYFYYFLRGRIEGFGLKSVRRCRAVRPPRGCAI